MNKLVILKILKRLAHKNIVKSKKIKSSFKYKKLTDRIFMLMNSWLAHQPWQAAVAGVPTGQLKYETLLNNY